MAIENKLNADAADNFYWHDFDNVYYKIDPQSIKIDIERGKIKVGVRGFASKYAREKDGLPIYKRVFTLDLDPSVNIGDRDSLLSYCYQKLKELPEFADAKDV